MSESKSPEKKKKYRRLSISKTKQNASEKGKQSNPSSILAFFNHIPPAKFACPICGELVPRYGLNKHLDELCQKDQNVHGNDVILVEPANVSTLKSGLSSMSTKHHTGPPPAKKARDPGTIMSPSRITCEVRKANVVEQSSPYFKQDVLNCSQNGGMDAQDVNPVVSLSSKLSRSYQSLKKGGDSKNSELSQIESVYCETDNSINCGVDNVSQKENLFKEKTKQDIGATTQTTAKEKTTAMFLANDSGNAEGEQGCDAPTFASCSDKTFEMASPSRKKGISKVSTSLGKRSREQGKFAAKIPKLGGRAISSPENYMNAELSDSSSAYVPLLTKDGMVAVSDSKYMYQKDSCIPESGVEELSVDDPNILETDTLCGALEPFEEKDPSRETSKKEDSAKSSLLHQSGQPYYLRNFLMVVQTIMDNEDDTSLFNDQDTIILSKFLQLSAGSQKLYVRLFQRKLNWIKVNKIEYAEIGVDLSPIIEELVHSGFFQTESELIEVSEVLDLLPAPELKILAKTFHLDNINGQKQQLIESFLRLAKQRSIFSFGQHQSGIGRVILKRAKELAGRCVRVCRAPRAVFSRVLLLFSLTDSMEVEEAASGGQTQLSTVLMVNMGRMIFPTYAVNRKTKIFQDREDLIRYETAMHTLIDIAAATSNGKWEEAHQLYQCAKESWKELKDNPNLSHHEKLPVYLRCFTVGWVYTRIRSRGVEILQRLHLYVEAVDELESLLSQTVYCPDSRGRWWDRLALNLHQHLKRTEKAVGYVLEGLADPFVRTGHRLALYQRALRIRESASCKKLRHLFQNMPVIEVEDVTHVTIKGKMFPHTGMGKSVFLREEVCDEESSECSMRSTVMCSVEELALAHYRQQGYDQGIHGEGSTFSTLFSLLMWDIIFMEGVPDVFRNSYQAFPLDLYTDSFFENRRNAVETRIKLIEEACTETLKQMIADVWNTQEGKAAALASWERFTSLEQAQSLVSCFGGPFLSGVCMRLSKDLRHCRGGLPDLVVWNTKNCNFKVVEVKGPNDRLSQKQMIWLDELRKLGADVEVCHVVAIGAKSQRIS